LKGLDLRALVSLTQYSKNPSKAEGTRSERQILKNSPFHPVKEFWKGVRSTLPGTLLRVTQRLFLCLFTSKKWKKISTEGAQPRNPKRTSKALTKAQLLGYNWAGAALISVSTSFSNLEKGRRTPTVLKTT